MHEPTTTIATAGGLMLFGFATGLHLGLIIAGCAGCWASLIFTKTRFSQIERLVLTVIAGMFSSWSVPFSISFISASKFIPEGADIQSSHFPLAAIIGFSLISIAPKLLKRGEQWIDSEKKTEENKNV